MSCSVCGRDARGFGYQKPVCTPFELPAAWRACSMLCLDIIAVRGAGPDPMELTRNEERALDAASDAAGAHLEQLGKTDLAQLTPEEWRDHLRCILVTATDQIRRLADAEAVPFQ